MCSMDRHWGAGQECSDVNPALPCVMGPGVCLHQSIQVQDAQARSQAQVSINITTGWGLRHAWHQSQLNHSMSQLCAAKRDISALVCLQTEHAYSEAERPVVGGWRAHWPASVVFIKPRGLLSCSLYYTPNKKVPVMCQTTIFHTWTIC